jgi:hypothetical protein
VVHIIEVVGVGVFIMLGEILQPLPLEERKNSVSGRDEVLAEVTVGIAIAKN